MQKIITLISGLFLSSIVIIGGIAFLSAALKPSEIITEKVINSGVENYKTKTANGIVLDKKRFFLELNGYPKVLKYYKSSEDYSSLQKSIKNNDILTVSYLHSNIRSIFKDKRYLIEYDKKFNTNSIWGVICILVGLVMMIFILIGSFKKTKR